jgi:predicted dienelactone hydrolase
MGPFALQGVKDCPIEGEKLPLVIISHGHGGDDLGHHDTAEALADAGFIAVALDHPGDTFSDMSRNADISVFFERPEDVKRLLDYLLGAWPNAAKIDAGRIGFFGFSRGGYTGLVIAGGNPDFHDSRVACPEPAPICGEVRPGEIPPGPLTHDPRFKAFVVADPLSLFPTADSLKGVKAPIQLWSSQYGGDGVLPEVVAALVRDLPEKPDFRIVAGAAHFAFLPPCPPGMAKAVPQICTDRPGFDRAAFHRDFDAEVVAFFRKGLNE